MTTFSEAHGCFHRGTDLDQLEQENISANKTNCIVILCIRDSGILDQSNSYGTNLETASRSGKEIIYRMWQLIE